MNPPHVPTDRAHRGALLPLALAALAVLAACTGGAAEEIDVGYLIQTGKYAEAIQVAERRLLSVPRGTEEERDLVLDYAAALSLSDGKKARDCFLRFAADNPELVAARHFLYVVSGLRTHERFVEALDVLHVGTTLWQDDPTFPALLEMLRADFARAELLVIPPGLCCPY